MDLTSYVKQISQEDFGWAFNHTATWNNRLKTTGGRFFPRDGHLDFNPKMLAIHGLDVFRQIVRHELCHYHLYFQKRGYKHSDPEFKALLKQVNGLRYAPKVVDKQPKYLYQCVSCGQNYGRQRRVDTQKYRCGKCRGRLVLRNQS